MSDTDSKGFRVKRWSNEEVRAKEWTWRGALRPIPSKLLMH